jgi:hypothetical protein
VSSVSGAFNRTTEQSGNKFARTRIYSVQIGRFPVKFRLLGPWTMKHPGRQLIRLGFLGCLLLNIVGLAFSQEQTTSVAVCQLKNDPAAFNHKLVEVTAFVSHAFEDFTLFDPTCSSWPEVWLEYGGKAKSGTMYCCGVTADRHRLKEMKVEDIPVPLTENEQFREFDKLIQPPFKSGRHGAVVHATLVGRFFSGRKSNIRRRRSGAVTDTWAAVVFWRFRK